MSKHVCLDTSVLVKALIPEEDSDKAPLLGGQREYVRLLREFLE